MNAEVIALVRTSFARINARLPGFAQAFYQRLFAARPALRPLFPGALPQQQEKFAAMLESILEALERPQGLAAMFAAMGERHAGYGVTEEHYDDVGVALLGCVHAALGEEWTQETEDAWATLYAEVAEAMIAASGERAQPA